MTNAASSAARAKVLVIKSAAKGSFDSFRRGGGGAWLRSSDGSASTSRSPADDFPSLGRTKSSSIENNAKGGSRQTLAQDGYPSLGRKPAKPVDDFPSLGRNAAATSFVPSQRAVVAPPNDFPSLAASNGSPSRPAYSSDAAAPKSKSKGKQQVLLSTALPTYSGSKTEPAVVDSFNGLSIQSPSVVSQSTAARPATASSALNRSDAFPALPTRQSSNSTLDDGSAAPKKKRVVLRFG